MNFDDETGDTEDESEIGSDELLADDNLRLPESANILVRVHAVRSWLTRRYEDTTLEVGEAALALQEAMQFQEQESRPRRRERAGRNQSERAQQLLSAMQMRLNAYEEAQTLLEECIAHASGERVLVEYYLALEDLVHDIAQAIQNGTSSERPRLQALADVQHRVERVGTPQEDD